MEIIGGEKRQGERRAEVRCCAEADEGESRDPAGDGDSQDHSGGEENRSGGEMDGEPEGQTQALRTGESVVGVHRDGDDMDDDDQQPGDDRRGGDEGHPVMQDEVVDTEHDKENVSWGLYEVRGDEMCSPRREEGPSQWPALAAQARPAALDGCRERWRPPEDDAPEDSGENYEYVEARDVHDRVGEVVDLVSEGPGRQDSAFRGFRRIGTKITVHERTLFDETLFIVDSALFCARSQYPNMNEDVNSSEKVSANSQDLRR